MSKAGYPVTQTVRFLRSKKVDLVLYVYTYEEHGGTAYFAKCVGKSEHQVIKAIVLQDEHKKGLVVLIHDDKHISIRSLTCELSLKHIEPAVTDQATRWTNYLANGVSPPGMKTTSPVYVEGNIWALDEISINDGKHGFIVGMKPENLRTLNLQGVHVAADA